MPASERRDRIAELEGAGVAGVLHSWVELEQLLGPPPPGGAAGKTQARLARRGGDAATLAS
ncbi:MAG: hypothetical protein ACJ76D_03935 [Solirubrobacterales bacterium]